MVEAKRPRRTAFSKAAKAIPDKDDTEKDEAIDKVDDRVIEKPTKRKTAKKKSAEDVRAEKSLVDGRLDILLRTPSEKESTQGLLIKFNKYWPYPMDLDEPEDRSLLLLSAYNSCGWGHCSLCGQRGADQNGPLELTILVDAEFSNTDYWTVRNSKVLPYEGWPAPKEAFEEECRQKWMRYFEGRRDPGKIPEFYSFYCTYKARVSPTADTSSPNNYCQPSEQIRDEQRRNGASRDSMNHFEFDVGHDWLKEVWYKGKFYVYFKLDKLKEGQRVSDVIQKLSLNSDAFFDGLLSDGFLDRSKKNSRRFSKTLSDTSDFVEAIVPEGFTLKLRDYQSRTLSWMKKIESETEDEDCCLVNIHLGQTNESFVKISLNNEPLYWDVFTGAEAGRSTKLEKITPNPATLKFTSSLRIRGGILADDTGSGKTVTSLALIHSCPFDEKKAADRLKLKASCLPYKIPSQATCVVVPGNLYQQWIDEANRCNPAFRIVGVSTFEEFKAISVQEVMLADIVIVTRELLNSEKYQNGDWQRPNTNYSYRQQRDEFMAISYYYETCPRATSFPFSFSAIHFHRVIYDEIHEIYNKSDKGKPLYKHFSADSYWGLTGTPRFKDPDDLQTLMPFLGISNEPKFLEKNVLADQEFIGKFIKRNIPDLQLPPVSQEVIWVDATPTELALMNASVMYSLDRARKIMMCCHYQLSDMMASAVGESFMTIEEVKVSFETAKMGEINSKRAKVQEISDMIEELLLEEDDDDEASKYRLESLQGKLNRANHELEASQSSYNYFTNVFKILEATNETEECLICRDQIAEENLAVLPCSHYYCYECIDCSMKRNLKCPFCSYKLGSRSEVIRIQGNLDKQGESLKQMGLDVTKYGSKLIAFYEFITNLFATEPDARVILFLQYQKLANFISSTLDELKIKHSRVHGSTADRTEAIRQFKNSKDTRIIMLSSEDSASGINLTETTHVVLLHPFWTGQGEAVDRAWEKQGISRAYRFGLNHPLKVIRFAVRNTIDEELTLARQSLFA